MSIELKRTLYRVKNGWGASNETLALAAHGQSPELAVMNLEGVIRMFLAPAERGGVLEKELQALGLKCDAMETDGIRIVWNED